GYRNWEWHYLNRLCNAEQLALACESAGLRVVAYPPDGTTLFAGGGAIGYGPFCGTQEIFRWNEKGVAVPAFHEKAPYGALTGMDFFPAGDRVAISLWCMDDARDLVLSAGETNEDMSGRLEVWDVAARKLLHTFKKHSSFVNGVAVSRDAKYVASASSDRTT